MARTCNFILWDEEKCGLPIGGGSATRCEFHAHVDQSAHLSNNQVVFNYINSCTRQYLDLTNVRLKGIKFDNLKFPGNFSLEVRFNNSEFEDCHFTNLSFQRSVSFRECRFLRTPFDSVDVDAEWIDFTASKFRGEEVPFRDCSFAAIDEIMFVDAIFESQDSPFTMCHAKSGLVSFMGASINSERFAVHVCKPGLGVVMPNSLVLDASHINLARLKCNGHFEYGNLERMSDVSPFVSFIYVDFRQMQSASLRNANLQKVWFRGSQVEEIVFANPHWPESGGRKCVFDDSPEGVSKFMEPLDSESPDSSESDKIDRDDRDRENTGFKQLLELYVSLKRNYESARNYIDAGDWFYREMECRRRFLGAENKSKWWRWLRQNIFSFPAWYRYISSYGENYTRPLKMILLMLFAFATVYFYWTGYPTDSGLVHYEFAFEFNDGAIGDFSNALAFSGGIMLLQFVKLAGEQLSPTPILAVVQVLLTLILVPLFLLALRRKFRR